MEMMGLCSICGKPGAMYSCSLCGKIVCKDCFDQNSNICKSCKKGKY